MKHKCPSLARLYRNQPIQHVFNNSDIYDWAMIALIFIGGAQKDRLYFTREIVGFFSPMNIFVNLLLR